jgi:hypothetical protein
MDLFEFIIAFFIVGVPALGITARLAFKPMVEAMILLRDSFGGSGGAGLVERRVMELEDEVRQLRSTVHELQEAEAFHRALLAPSAGDDHAG